MNGIINILKPPGMTSQNVVSFVKRVVHADKAGHTGTLDPGATGVLPVCIGKATRIAEYLIDDKKSYRAEMKLGQRSDTLDKYGTIERLEMPFVSEDDIRESFSKFIGNIEQIPPMFSAVRVGGERLYDLARQGVVVERKSRNAFIYDMRILKICNDSILFDVTCSKGTYIRSLCSDIGKSLGSDAIMTFLIRTATGPFSINDAVTLDELKQAAEQGDIDKIIHPLESGLEGCSRVTVDSSTAEKARHGMGFKLDKNIRFEKKEKQVIILIFDTDNKFVAVGRMIDNVNVKIDKVFS